MFFGASSPHPTQILDCLPAYLGLVVAMFSTLYLGQKWGTKLNSTGQNTVKEWIGIVDGPILALYGLLLAFTFYGSMQRFDERRRFAVDEVTLLSTAFRQLDRLQPEDRRDLSALLKQYITERVDLYQDSEKSSAWLHHCRELQKEIWQRAQVAVDRPDTKSDAASLLSTVDQWINLLTRGSTIPQFHPPWQVMALFVFLAMVSSFLVGFQISSLRWVSWPHIFLFVFVLALVTYLIIDLEYPYVGFIRMVDGQEILRHLMETIQP
jgi:hypothetical protein